MKVSPENTILESLALGRLGQFVRQRRKMWQMKGLIPDLEGFEAELHEHIIYFQHKIFGITQHLDN